MSIDWESYWEDTQKFEKTLESFIDTKLQEHEGWEFTIIATNYPPNIGLTFELRPSDNRRKVDFTFSGEHVAELKIEEKSIIGGLMGEVQETFDSVIFKIKSFQSKSMCSYIIYLKREQYEKEK